MKSGKQKESYKAVIQMLIRILSKFVSRLDSWILDLRYAAFMADFGSRDDDIWVATYMKSGTTLTQMILYQLTTDGNMNFRHINDKCPWIRNAASRGLQPADVPSPRILKTHDDYDVFEKNIKGRFIFVIRDGLDVTASYYHHKRNYNNPNVTFNEVFEKSVTQPGRYNWFEFVQKWLENKNNLPILYIRYEDILNDLDATVRRIAEFCDLPVTESIMSRVVERCSFDFMKKHEEKFGIERSQEPHVYDQFIRKGKAGEGKKYLNESQKTKFKKRFERDLENLMKRRMGISYEYSGQNTGVH